MDLLQIPFIKHVRLQKNNKGNLQLGFSNTNLNHLKTIHAGAQFTLAESASGEMLQISFPQLVGKVIPVLRDSQFKFKKPALKTLTAFPTISDKSKTKFNQQFEKKGRALITVSVTLKDNDEVIASAGEFTWFIQSAQ